MTALDEYKAANPDLICGCMCGCSALSSAGQSIWRGTPSNGHDDGLCKGCMNLWLFLSEKCECDYEDHDYCRCGAIKHSAPV